MIDHSRLKARPSKWAISTREMTMSLRLRFLSPSAASRRCSGNRAKQLPTSMQGSSFASRSSQLARFPHREAGDTVKKRAVAKRVCTVDSPASRSGGTWDDSISDTAVGRGGRASSSCTSSAARGTRRYTSRGYDKTSLEEAVAAVVNARLSRTVYSKRESRGTRPG